MNQFGIFLTICTVACLLQNAHITIAGTTESTAATESTSSTEPSSTATPSTTSASITSSSITQPSTTPAITTTTATTTPKPLTLGDECKVICDDTDVQDMCGKGVPNSWCIEDHCACKFGFENIEEGNPICNEYTLERYKQEESITSNQTSICLTLEEVSFTTVVNGTYTIIYDQEEPPEHDNTQPLSRNATSDGGTVCIDGTPGTKYNLSVSLTVRGKERCNLLYEENYPLFNSSQWTRPPDAGDIINQTYIDWDRTLEIVFSTPNGNYANCSAHFLYVAPIKNEAYTESENNRESNTEEGSVKSGQTFNCTHLQVKDVSAGSNYRLEVTVVGLSGFNSSRNFSISPNISAPDPVTDLKVTDVTNSSAKVEWSTPETLNYSKPVSGYYVTLQDSVNGTFLQCANLSKVVQEEIKYTIIGQYKFRSNCSETGEHISNDEGMMAFDSSKSNEKIGVLLKSLDPHHEYNVAVSAWNSLHTGPPENVSFTTLVAKPEALTNFTGYAISSSEIHLSWVLPSINPGPLKYTISVFTGNKGSGTDLCNKSVVVTGYSNTSITIDDLEPYTFYTFEIYAETSAGKSNITTFGPVRTHEAVSGNVSELKYQEASTNISLSWQPPQNVNGELNAYIIFVHTREQVSETGKICKQIIVLTDDKEELPNQSYCSFKEGNEKVMPFQPDNVSVTIESLLPFTNYTITVAPVNGLGVGNLSTVDPQTLVAVPDKPSNFSGIIINSTAIEISWVQPTTNPGPLSYIINVFNVEDDRSLTKSVILTGYSNTATTIDDLAPYTIYTFEIYAETSAGNSTTETFGPVRTHVAEPDAPNNITGNATSFSEIYLTWEPPLINPGPLTYNISVFTVKENSEKDSFLKSVVVTGYSNTSITIDDLKPYTFYTFAIYAETSAGKSNTTTFGPVRTHEAVSGNVSGLKYKEASTTISLSWWPPQNVNGELKAYIIFVHTGEQASETEKICEQILVLTNNTELPNQSYCSLKDGDEKVIPFQPDNVSVTIESLLPYTNYTITVAPVNSLGVGAVWTVYPQTTIAVPNPPIGLYCDYPTSRTLKVLWEPPLPNPGPTWYFIEVLQSRLPFNSSKGFDTFRSYSVTGYNNTAQIVDDVKPYWDYSVMIMANTEAGNSSMVTTSEPCHTPSASPGPVDSLEVDVLPDNKVLLTWSCPKLENRNGIIEKFQVKQTPVNLSREDIKLSSIEPINKTIEALNTNESCETQYSFSSNVVPQVTYRFEVWAKVEEVDELGNVTWEEKSISGSAPVVFFPDSDIVRPTPSSNELTLSTFNITICMKCLVNNSNGQIIAVGILVCKEGFCDDGIPDSKDQVSAFLSGLANWSQSRQQQFKKAFRVTTNDWQDSLLSGYIGLDKSTSVDDLVFQVGSNLTCSTKLSDEVCNGPLPSGEKFQVRFYACTEAGCSVTGTSGPYITAASVSEAVDPGLVGGAVGGCIMALLVIVLVVVFRRRLIGKHKKSDAQANRSNGVHQDIALTGIGSKDDSEDEDRCRPIKIGVFKEQLDKLHDNNNKLFEQEYTDLSMQTREHSMEVGARSEYRLDNRYTNILPYDHSRVELSVVKDNEDCSKSYINANFIPGFSSAKEFIATQGPLERTVKDFWRMVWEQGSSVIVMLSNFKEEDKQSKILKDKVHPYFPEEEESNAYSYGQISVCKTGIVESKEWEIRTFKLTHMKEQKSRFVKHFFFKYWSDHEADVHPSDMADFVQVVCEESSSRNTGPVVVHCSAGVGRTGTFICVSYFYKMISDLSKNVDRNLNRAADQTVDIFNRVLHLRDRRRFMVQTRVQYLFIYDTVLELIGRFLTVPNDAADGSNEDEKNAEHVYANVSDYMNFNGVSSQKVNGAFSMADEAKSEEETVYISMSASTKPLLKSEEAEEEPTYVNLSSSIKPESKFGKAEEGSTFANLGSSKRPLSKLGKAEENSTYANLGSSKRYVSQLGNGEENSTSANFGSSKRYGSTLGKAEENSTYANLGSSKRYGSTLGKAEENSTSANLARSSRTVRL